jgi:peptidoglycan/xylan/chitin deacetylase (PgdA/CDA1 family)
MKRRAFMASMLGGALAACIEVRPQHVRPQVAVTFDDPRLDIAPSLTPHAVNDRILNTLAERRLQTALFVCGHRIDSPDGRSLVSEWDTAGHLIANHSYSHLHYHGTSYENFAADFVRNVPVVERFRHHTRLFRYPFLKAGDTVEKRDRFRALLRQHDYRNGAVTIDASDWYVDRRLRQRLGSDASASTDPYRDYYVAHLLDRGAYYRQLARDVLGHEIPHTLLLHHNIVNALFLPDVMAAFENAGWEWINASTAFEDPVFSRAPEAIPAGESLVWALAAEAGKFGDRLRYPGEDGRYEAQRMDALGL